MRYHLTIDVKANLPYELRIALEGILEQLRLADYGPSCGEDPSYELEVDPYDDFSERFEALGASLSGVAKDKTGWILTYVKGGMFKELRIPFHEAAASTFQLEGRI